ncbi:MAG: PfkB family carbohydrate kinase [Acidobacteriota bacterium]
MKILVVGSIAYDTVRTPSGFRSKILGGSATYFSVSASFFSSVGIVAVVGSDFNMSNLRLLKERGVDCSGIGKAGGKTFHWEGEYGADLNVAVTKRTELNVFKKFDPVLPERFMKSPVVFLANIDPDLQWKVLQQTKSPRLVVCDTMNFWIENKLSSLRKVIGKVDILLLNEGEAKQLTGQAHLVKAIRKISTMGPHTVVVKRGEYGAMMIHKGKLFVVPAFLVERVIDPTGAGDSFAGGFVGYLSTKRNITELTLRQAIIHGSIMASFDVQNFSLDSFRNLAFRDIKERYRQFKKMTCF